MARKVINFNSLILKAMHRPLIGEHVLYTRVYGATDDENATKAEQDEKYKKASQYTYNSPTNIRRIFITGKRVVVHVYTPFIVKGKAYDSYVIDTSYNNSSVGISEYGVSDLFDVIKHFINERNELEEYRANKLNNPKLKEPTTYRIDGNVLKVLSSTYACNNVEEIYFDYTALLAEELKPYVQQISFENNWQHYVNSQSFSFNSGDFFKQALAMFNNIGIQNISNKFPRLRQVGMISNLDAVLKHNAQKDHCSFIRDTKDTRSWYEVNENLIKASKSVVFMSYIKDPSNRMPNTEFNIKDNQYKFDREVLKDKVNTYKKSVEDLLAGKITNTDESNSADEDKETTNAELTELDNKIISLFNNGTDQARFIIGIAAEGMTLSERKSIADSIVEKYNNVQYRKLVSQSLGIK